MRRDPVAILEEQALTRGPELVPIRHGRMLVSAFTFYRGRGGRDGGGPRAGPDRRLIFSVNDFDETLPGPFEWDVKRLVASFAVAGRDRGFDAPQRQAAILAAARTYRKAMREFAGMRALDLWYARMDVEELSAKWAASMTPADQALDRNIAKARAKDSLRAAGRLTEMVDGQPRIIRDPPLIVPIEDLLPPAQRIELEQAVRTSIRSYRRSLPSDRRHLLERFRYFRRWPQSGPRFGAAQLSHRARRRGCR